MGVVSKLVTLSGWIYHRWNFFGWSRNGLGDGTATGNNGGEEGDGIGGGGDGYNGTGEKGVEAL